jgi:lipopolysaccharide transport system permease protein
MFYQEFKKMMLTTIMPFIKRITLYELLVNLYDFRNLLLELTSKNIVARYKQSFLGLAWAIILPVATTALFTMIKIFINIPSEGIPYPVFFLSALIPWSLFSNQETVASGSIVLNEALIKKIYFPREVLTVSAVFTRILDFIVSFGILIILMIYFNVPILFYFLFIPLLFLIQTIFALSIGLFVAALGAYRRDFIVAVPIVMQFWMFASPVIYPLSSVPMKFRSIYTLNPMAGFIESYRSILIRGEMPVAGNIVYISVVSIMFLAFSYIIFKKLEGRFADVL